MTTNTEPIAKEAMFLRPGDRLLTELHLHFAKAGPGDDEGPFGFPARRDPQLRRLLGRARLPHDVEVIGVEPVPFEPNSIAALIDFGPGLGTYSLSLNRERVVHVIEANTTV